MLYSAYFAERAEHYRNLARRTLNGCRAENQLSSANLFLEMSFDMRLRELAVEPAVQRDQNRTHVINRDSRAFSQCRLWPERRTSDTCTSIPASSTSRKGLRRLFRRAAEETFDICVEHLR
jgi:hypothetical protein